MIGVCLQPSWEVSAQDKALFSIDDREVTLDEFKYIYEKNNRDKADYTEKSVKEYLDLYVNFKLKVHKAKELGYDKTDTYQSELAGYRSQLADSYVIDKEVLSKMAQEIYERQQKDIELQHLFLGIAAKSSREDLDKVRANAKKIRSQIGKELTWERAVAMHSQDRASAQYNGDIGFINAPLPEGFVALEEAAYTLPVGGISDPVQTKNGFHIIKVVSSRPARGEMEAKHLLIRKEKNDIPLANAYPRVKKIYDQINNGERTFEQATIISSEDTDTKGNEGYLGFFTIGQYDRAFEDAAFGLDKDGMVSEPVETSVGWHIIKRISKRSFDELSIIQERLKNAPLQGERFERKRSDVVAEIQAAANYKEDRKLLDKYINTLTEDYFTYKWQLSGTPEGVLVSYGDDKYGTADFADFLKKSAKSRMRDKGQLDIKTSVTALFEEFSKEKAISYSEDRLEDQYPEFRNLMREYREGILLFDIAKDHVWDKAASDTMAIEKYFENHRDDYKWEERYQLTKYTVKSVTPLEITKILNKARTISDPEALLQEVNKDKEVLLYKEEVLEASHQSLEGMTLREGFVTSPSFNNKLRVTTFTKVEEIIPARPKTLKEAKGYVISDYQDQLKKEWTSKLRNNYKVKINQKRLKSLYQ